VTTKKQSHQERKEHLEVVMQQKAVNESKKNITGKEDERCRLSASGKAKDKGSKRRRDQRAFTERAKHGDQSSVGDRSEACKI
jgi:hypothetical protein